MLNRIKENKIKDRKECYEKRINPETILEDSILNLVDKLHIAKKNNTKRDITT